MGLFNNMFVLFHDARFPSTDNLSPTQYSEHQLHNYSAQAISWIGSVQLFLTVRTVRFFGP